MRRIHQMSPNVTGRKGLVEINFHIKDEHREGHGVSDEDESRINELAEDVNDSHGEEDVATPTPNCQMDLQKQQQLPGPIVRWERFLLLRTLKVLLVENDDSTRQVLTALLRNCGYEVTATANGFQAWKILEDLNNHVDLVLTEVVMPCLSGYGLLCKIMNHKTCKNIPVIMMSSNDSMGTVFKCLSKGAVDFLVKPIRKNELKNLWQHVWRRCHSSSGSGSGSESGIQTQKSAKSPHDYDNNSGSNDEDDNGSIGLNVKDGSDTGSGTQSSWTRRAVEFDSPQTMSPADQLADPHDSTCVQVIRPKPETFCNEWVPVATTKPCLDEKELVGDDFMGKDLEIGVPRNPVVQHESNPTEKVSNNLTGTNLDKLHEHDSERVINHTALEHENSNAGEPSTKAADLFGGTASSKDAQQVTKDIDTPSGFSKISENKDKTVAGSNELSLELSLKRPISSEEGGTVNYGDHRILRHSDLSAFSRYNTSAASAQAPTGCGGYCSMPRDNNLEPVKTESTHNMISNSNAAPLNQGSNGSSDNNDMGSTTKNAFTKPPALKEKMVTTSPVNFIKPLSAFHSVQHQAAATQQVMQEKIDDAAVAGQARGIHRQIQVQHHHHHYHHHVHRMQQQQLDHDDMSLKNMETPTLQCGSSIVFVGQMEGNAANYSVNGSNSGSNHGSNGQNGSSTAVNAGGMNMDIDNRLAGISGGGGGNGSGSRSGVDQNWLAQREAALNKFRQKRKERNFEKKVRYQSRKKLAEQRPRVRGQFVRQNAYECKNQDADS